MNEILATGEVMGIWIIDNVVESGEDIQGVETDDELIMQPMTDLKNVGSLILTLLTLLNVNPNTTVTVC